MFFDMFRLTILLMALSLSTPSYAARCGGDFNTFVSTMSQEAAAAGVSQSVISQALGGVSLVHVSIGTGRTHQIRVHLSEAGHPVVGDALYGGRRKSVPPRLAALSRLDRPFLHAFQLTFSHPTDGRSMTFEAPLPEDLRDVLGALRRASGQTS